VDGLQPLERKVAQYNPYLRLPDKKYPQQASMEKPHINDACIDSNLKAIRTDEQYRCAIKRKNNRQLHKANYLKGGRKKKNQAPHTVKGFRLLDRVDYKGNTGFIFGRRTSGYFDVRQLDGIRVHVNASHKKLKLMEPASTLLIERRLAG